MGSVWVIILGSEVESAEIAHVALLDLMLVSFKTTYMSFSSYREEIKEAA